MYNVQGDQMQLIRLIIIIACVAGVVWAINKYTSIDPKFKQLILIVGLVGSIIWALHDFGVF
jgi:Flp pilus assembly protein TadB